jgi:hypothetical protein
MRGWLSRGSLALKRPYRRPQNQENQKSGNPAPTDSFRSLNAQASDGGRYHESSRNRFMDLRYRYFRLVELEFFDLTAARTARYPTVFMAGHFPLTIPPPDSPTTYFEESHVERTA